MAALKLFRDTTEEPLDSATLALLGLDSDPFMKAGNDPGPDEQPVHTGDPSYFSGGKRERHLEHLSHLARWARSVVLVTGESQIGKSTLFQEVVARLAGQSVQYSALYGGALTSPIELMARIAHGLGMSLPSKLDAQALSADIILHCARENERHDRASVVLVDDAHELNADSLAALADLAVRAAQTRALNLVLFAEPRFVMALQRAAKNLQPELVWHELRLKPLDEDEVQAYLEFRLQASGHRGRVPFSRAQLNRLLQKSEGLPGRIDALARDALHRVALQRAGNGGLRARLWALLASAASMPLLLAAVVVVLSTGLFSVLWFPDRYAAGDATEIRGAFAGNTTGVTAASATGGSVEVMRPPVIEPIVLLDSTTQPDLQSDNRPVENSASENNASDNKASDNNGSDTIVEVASATIAVAAEPTEPTQTLERDAEALLALDSSAFTWQILGSSSESAVDTFLNTQNVSAALKSYVTQRNGERWIVVLQGVYSDRQEALSRRPELPGTATPWLRRIASVQEDLRVVGAP